MALYHNPDTKKTYKTKQDAKVDSKSIKIAKKAQKKK